MSEPYLIAHLVYGSPAFDIAIRCDDMGTESDPGPWWIIPTSGHRAYPYWYIAMDQLYPEELIYGDSALDYANSVGDALLLGKLPAPPDWPDHYTTYAAPRTGLITNLAERLGFVPKPTTINRR